MKKFRKIIALLMAVSILMLTAACSGSNRASDAAKPGTEPTKAA